MPLGVVDIRHHFNIRSVTSERDTRRMKRSACRINPKIIYLTRIDTNAHNLRIVNARLPFVCNYIITRSK